MFDIQGCYISWRYIFLSKNSSWIADCINVPNLVVPIVPSLEFSDLLHDSFTQIEAPSFVPIPQPSKQLMDSSTNVVVMLNTVNPVPRRSARPTKLPSYLNEYHTHLQHGSKHHYSCITSHLIQNYISYDRLSHSYRSFISI